MVCMVLCKVCYKEVYQVVYKVVCKMVVLCKNQATRPTTCPPKVRGGSAKSGRCYTLHHCVTQSVSHCNIVTLVQCYTLRHCVTHSNLSLGSSPVLCSTNSNLPYAHKQFTKLVQFQQVRLLGDVSKRVNFLPNGRKRHRGCLKG